MREVAYVTAACPHANPVELRLQIEFTFLDNPILDEAENSLMYFAIGGFVIGIVVMLIFNILRRPKKQG